MQRIVAETCEDAAAEEFLMLGPIPNGPLSSWSFYGFPCSFGIFFVFFWGDGAMLLFNLWEAQLGGNPITDHL